MEQKRSDSGQSEASLGGESIENWVAEQGRRFAAALLKDIVEQLDDQFYRSGSDHWICQGFEERTVETAAGRLTYRRRVYVNRASGEEVVPVDQYLGWDTSGEISSEAMAMCSRLASSMSFGDMSGLKRHSVPDPHAGFTCSR